MMILPKKLKIKDTDTEEIKQLKKTINDLLDFHYQFHQSSPHFHNANGDMVIGEQGMGGGGC